MLKKYVINIFKIFLVFLMSESMFAKGDIPYVQGVDYFPEHYGEYLDDFGDSQTVSDDDIEKDFFVMSQNFNSIRTYSYDPINLQRVLRAAKRYDMKVALGLMIDINKPKETDDQISELSLMFEQYPDLKSPVITIVIGNNVIRDSDRYFSTDGAYLFDKIKQISKMDWFVHSTMGISISEIDLTLSSNAGIYFLSEAAKINLRDKLSIFININPYLSGCTVEEAVGEKKATCKRGSFSDRWNKVISLKEAKNFQIILGETGWPTNGPGKKRFGSIVPGRLEDAIKFYNFLYPYLKTQLINGNKISVPFFVFTTFDNPFDTMFGMQGNYWGVYNFDRSVKKGMIYPIQDRVVRPSPKLGTNIKIFLSTTSPYSNLPILFKSGNNIFSNILPKDSTNKPKVYSFIKRYPFVEYSLSSKSDEEDVGPHVVTLTLPNSSDDTHKAAICTNELISGNGYGRDDKMNLKWKYSHSKEDNCQHVYWSESGIRIN